MKEQLNALLPVSYTHLKKPVESELNIATNKSNTTEKYFENKPKKRTHDTRIVKKKRTSYSTTPKKKKFITEKEQDVYKRQGMKHRDWRP